MDFKDIIEKNQLFIISSHVGPDGDNVSSSLAFKLALQKLGKEAYYIIDDELPQNLSFLRDYDKQLTSEKIQGYLEGKEYVFIGLDCGVVDRLKISKTIFKNSFRVINIDHHEKNEMYGDYNFVDENMSSTCELVYHHLKEYYPQCLTRDVATCLYAGILTDSGNFMYDCANSTTLMAASDLLEKGADRTTIVNSIFRSQDKNYLKLLSEVLSTIQVDGILATAYLKKDMLERYHISYNDVENLVDYVINIYGVKIGILFKEKDIKEIKLSLRSKGDLDVASFARKYSGGGHKNAAGCSITGLLDEVMESVIKSAKEYIL